LFNCNKISILQVQPFVNSTISSFPNLISQHLLQSSHVNNAIRNSEIKLLIRNSEIKLLNKANPICNFQIITWQDKIQIFANDISYSWITNTILPSALKILVYRSFVNFINS
jgi:hypothetical protein